MRRWQSFDVYAILKFLALEISPLLPKGLIFYSLFTSPLLSMPSDLFRQEGCKYRY